MKWGLLISVWALLGELDHSRSDPTHHFDESRVGTGCLCGWIDRR